ncbi:MAG: hypothetical protein ABWY28_05530 [Pseudomonas prosekii]
MASIESLPGTIKQVNYDTASGTYSFVITPDNGGADVTATGYSKADYSVGDKIEWRQYLKSIQILRKN